MIPGNSGSLWEAVKVAKDVNHTNLPGTMYEEGSKIENVKLVDRFAEFFDRKIKKVVSETNIDHKMFNGNRKLFCNEGFFIDRNSVKEYIESLVTKNSEGYNRIPQRIIKDGCEVLIDPFNELFKKI
jgi:hypothetical protein